MKILKLLDLITEAGGQSSGKLELVKTPVEKAHQYIVDQGFNLDSEIPNFDKNYVFAQKNAGRGWTQRRNMPVITDDDVKQLQQRLSKGYIDINAPHADEWVGSNPFPQGLAGGKAEK
jgi:hypothetical protein